MLLNIDYGLIVSELKNIVAVIDEQENGVDFNIGVVGGHVSYWMAGDELNMDSFKQF